MSDLFESLQNELHTREQQDAFSSIDLLNLPPALAAFIGKILHNNGMSLSEITTEFAQPPDSVKALLDAMIQKGYLRRVTRKQQPVYKANFRRKPRKTTNSSELWSALDGILE